MGIHARERLVALGVGIASAAAIAIRFPGSAESSTLPVPGVLLPFFIIAATFLAGNEIRVRQQRSEALEDRADRLERESEDAIRAAAATERRHIARELHDIIAHSVSVMVVQAGAARQVLEEKPAAARQSLMAVEASGREALAELRRLLGVIETKEDDPPLGAQPGLDAVETLVERVRTAGLETELRIEGSRAFVPPGVDVAAYRVVQEALTNALRYAGGAPTHVLVRYSPHAIELEIQDEGKVASPSDGIGRGLAGMRERVALYGGTLETGAPSGSGFVVRAQFPIAESP
jgi:signal transduction histidine kinase